MWLNLAARRALLVALGALAVLSLGAAQAGAANLPNGRAYEQVSPPDKNGQDVVTMDPNRSAGVVEQGSSTSGDAVVYAAESAFPGSAANTILPQYLSLREPPSWSTVALAPPVAPTHSTNHPPGVFQLTEDHSRAVVRSNAVLAPGGWGSEFSQGGVAFYLRDLSDDSYRVVTPAPPVWGGAGGTPYLSLFIGASADLNHVLFETTAALTADAVPLNGPKLYKWSDGELTLESYLPDPDGPGPAVAPAVTGSAGGINSSPDELVQNALSSDGSRVFFTPTGAGAPSAVRNRLFVRENGTTTQIAPPGGALFRGATSDGDHVFFTQGGRLFRYDVDPDGSGPAVAATALLSVDDEPADDTSHPTSAQGVLGFSDDGLRVYFAARGQLVDGAPLRPPDESQEANVYLWDNGVVKFIASPPVESETDGAWGIIAQAARNRYVGRDGAGLVLWTRDSLTGYDNGNPDCPNGACAEVFLYDAGDSTRVSPDLVCVSCDPSGAPPSGDVSAPDGLAFGGRHLSDGAGRAFFHSPDALVPGDSNGRDDVYMWEGGELQLISTGRSVSNSVFLDASASGDDLFFLTRERLVGWDQDDARDVYDAKVGGGLPEPPPPPLACSGDPCQGPPSGRPALADPGSSFLRGLGDLRPGARASFRVRRLSGAQRSLLARGRRVVLAVRVNQAGRVSAAARARMGGRMRVVARSSKRARRAGSVGVPLRLSKQARGALARRGRLGVRVAVRFSRVREAKTLTLRLRRAAAPAGGKGR